MNFNIDYYFKDIEEKSVFFKLVSNASEVMQVFTESSKFIAEIAATGEQQIKTNNIQDNVKILGAVYIDEGTVIQSGCIIEGPVYIGKNCVIMYNSYIRPGTIMDNNCVVGFGTEIKHTIMREGSKASDLVFIGDSIIGKNARVGSGVIIANRAFNQANIVIKDVNKNKIDLQRQTMGIVLGDNSRIGCNCTTSPGTFIGQFTWIYPHTVVHGFIPSQKKVYNKQNLVLAENEKKILSPSTTWNHDEYN